MTDWSDLPKSEICNMSDNMFDQYRSEVYPEIEKDFRTYKRPSVGSRLEDREM